MRRPPRQCSATIPRLTTDIVEGDFSPGADIRKLEIGVNVFPDLPPGLVLPASPDWVNITAEEASRHWRLTPTASCLGGRSTCLCWKLSGSASAMAAFSP